MIFKHCEVVKCSVLCFQAIDNLKKKNNAINKSYNKIPAKVTVFPAADLGRSDTATLAES